MYTITTKTVAFAIRLEERSVTACGEKCFQNTWHSLAMSIMKRKKQGRLRKGIREGENVHVGGTATKYKFILY